MVFCLENSLWKAVVKYRLNRVAAVIRTMAGISLSFFFVYINSYPFIYRQNSRTLTGQASVLLFLVLYFITFLKHIPINHNTN